MAWKVRALHLDLDIEGVPTWGADHLERVRHTFA